MGKHSINRVNTISAKAESKNLPPLYRPMLATLVDKPFKDSNWSYEIKWDGYRALAFLNKGDVELKSRNDKSFNDKFYALYDSLKKWKINAVIDGEIVIINDKGVSNFGKLQNWRSEADGELIYYVFDILWLDGKDLTQLSFLERRKILHSVIPKASNIRISEVFDASGEDFYKSALKLGLEGIMAKKNDSIYQSGERSKDWLKIKANKRHEVVIGGFTKNKGSDKPFSSLLVGIHEKGKLRYIGKIGTGFNIKTQLEILVQMKKLTSKTNPFTELPDINKPSRFQPNPPKSVATWLKPKLVCEVSYTEMTTDGVMRHPSFEGMRIDKKASDVVAEVEVETDEVIRERKTLANKKMIVPAGKKERKTLLNPKDERQVREINGHNLAFTNLSKVFWPDSKITKRDMLNYYYQIAPFILPYLKDRPHTMNRFPNGINGKSFYQKDVKGKVPDWIDTFTYYSEFDKREKEFFIATNEASLLYMASLACIEMHPWHSRKQSPDNPDWCVIDLDPDKNSFEQVIKAAQVTHQLLDSIDIPSYCKTSGSTGLHIYIPLGAKYSYEESKEFGRKLVTIIQKELPKFTTIKRYKDEREGKMYLDFLQNRPQATIAAPYSLRPKPDATVSMPLYWDEVKSGLKMKNFTIKNAVQRALNLGDIFMPVIGKGINLENALKKLKK